MRPDQERDQEPYEQRQPGGPEQSPPPGEQPPPAGGQQPPQGPPEQPPWGGGQQAPQGSGQQPTGGAGQQQQETWNQPPGRAQQQPSQTGSEYQTYGSRYSTGGAPTGQTQQAPPAGQQATGGQQAYGGQQETGQQQYGTQQMTQQPPARASLRPMTVEDIVQTDVVTAETDTPIATVVAEMAEKDVGSVVIVDGEIPVDVLTDRRIALTLETDPDVTERTAGDLVGEALVTGSMDMSVSDALGRMSEEGIRRLPIVDEDRTLAGIVTLDDVLVLLSEDLRKAADVIEAQSPRR